MQPFVEKHYNIQTLLHLRTPYPWPQVAMMYIHTGQVKIIFNSSIAENGTGPLKVNLKKIELSLP